MTSTASGLTDVDGRFELAGLEEGAYQVKASRAGGTLTYPQRVTLPVNRDLVFDLGAARIEGAVVDARNARAVSGAVLSLRSRGDGGLRGFSVDGLVATGPGGRFVFHDVSSGDYSLVVEAPGFASGLRVVEVPSGVTAEWVTFELGSDHDS